MLLSFDGKTQDKGPENLTMSGLVWGKTDRASALPVRAGGYQEDIIKEAG